MDAIQLQGVVKRFGDVEALRGLDLAVGRGEVVGLLGPNGAGKTTTVRVLSTLVQPDAGRVVVDDHDVVAEPAAVRSVLGLTGQFAAVDGVLTATENLVLFGRLRGMTKGEARARAAKLLDTFGLVEVADARAATFSGGMRRRLDLAASLVVEPTVLVLDEPTTGLDPRSRFALWDVVRDLRSRGITILLTTQYLEEADQLADRIAVVDHGRVIAEGTAAELKARVGGSSLDVVVTDPSTITAAVDAVATAVGPPATVDADGGRLSVPASAGVADLTAALRALDAAGIAVDDIGLRRPSLDDVFLELTGRPVVDDPVEAVG